MDDNMSNILLMTGCLLVSFYGNTVMFLFQHGYVSMATLLCFYFNTVMFLWQHRYVSMATWLCFYGNTVMCLSTGIGGLEDHILKSGTLSSSVACPSFTDLYFDASPILRVALEPTHAGEHSIRTLSSSKGCSSLYFHTSHIVRIFKEIVFKKCVGLINLYAHILKIVMPTP